MSTALCLVGAGARGIYGAGMLRYIYEHKIPFDTIYGTSSGALNAALVAQESWDLLEHLWLNIKTKDVMSLAPWKIFPPSVSLYDSTPLFRTIQKHVDLEKLHKATKPCHITVTDLHKQEPIYIRITGEVPYDPHDIHQFLLASASIPGAFPRVMGRLVDGGCMDDYCLDIAVDEGAKELIVLHPNRPGRIAYNTMLDVIECGLMLGGWANYLKQMESMRIDKVPVKTVIPPQAMDLSIFDFDMRGKDRKKMLQYGYSLAQSVFES